MDNIKQPVSEQELKSENLTNAEAFGVDAQLMQAIEEMAELIQALNKAQRYIFHPKYPDERKVREAHHNVMEEIADVEIMTEQLKYLLGIPEDEIAEIKRYKIMRTTKRRKGGSHEKENQ